MRLFQKKEIYDFKLLQKCNIDIAKINEGFLKNGKTCDSQEEHEYCILVGESKNYYFWAYKTRENGRGGYILRQEKCAPNNVVFFGKNEDFACVFKGYLFLAKSICEVGKPSIIARKTTSGLLSSCDWLSHKTIKYTVFDVIRHYYQDSITDMFIENDKLVFKISRKKSDSIEDDAYDTYVDYVLTVKYKDKQFYVDSIFPKEIFSSEYREKVKNDKRPRFLGQDESKKILCSYGYTLLDCEMYSEQKKCDKRGKCAVQLKERGCLARYKQQYEEATTYYKEALIINPQYAEAWCNMGECYLLSNLLQEALNAVENALSIDPIMGRAMFIKAKILSKLNNPSEAVEVCDAILKLYNVKEVVEFKETLIS